MRVTRTGLSKLGFHNTSRGGILPFFLSTRQRKNDMNARASVIVTVCHAVKLTLESIEVLFFRRLDEHFIELQTMFGLLHERPLS